MCQHVTNITNKFNELGEIAIQALRKNKELEQYQILGNLSIEGTRDIVYVSDMNTDVIIFANENALAIFGEALGKKCYEVFHGLPEHCSFCTNRALAAALEVPINWVFYNEQTKELYYITDIAKEVEGRLLRFERATPLNGLTKKIVELATIHQLI